MIKTGFIEVPKDGVLSEKLLADFLEAIKHAPKRNLHQEEIERGSWIAHQIGLDPKLKAEYERLCGKRE